MKLPTSKNLAQIELGKFERNGTLHNVAKNVGWILLYQRVVSFSPCHLCNVVSDVLVIQ